MTSHKDPDNGQHGWSNSAEMLFIKGLAEKKNARGLLLGYLTGHSKRVNFGAIDQKAAGDFARQLLTRLEQEESLLSSHRAEVA
ncbi:hypothetical protein [Paraburkholderia caribensis]|uniref:hypothetical protein n=1 Tax=Paraburkholderia caribensis TaxID=75105 RepID=UPI0034D27689